MTTAALPQTLTADVPTERQSIPQERITLRKLDREQEVVQALKRCSLLVYSWWTRCVSAYQITKENSH